MIYEYRISVDSEKIMIPMWKQTIFQNINSGGHVVREEILLTSTMDFDNNVEAMVWPAIIIDAHFPESKKHITRVKIECPVDNRPFMANYYEAHFKMDRAELQRDRRVHDDFFRADISRSINKTTRALWATIRERHSATLKSKVTIFKSKYSAAIDEQDIEGVIFDSSPFVDYNWMAQNIG